MPNAEQLAEAKERRERRRLARESAIEQAHDQITAMPDELAKPKPKRTYDDMKQAKKTRRQLVEEQRAATEEQVRKQEKVLTSTTPDASKYLDPQYRGPIPLHVLNALAREQRNTVKEFAREVGNAAGRAAHDTALGRKPANIVTSHDKMRRVRDAQDKLAAEAART